MKRFISALLSLVMAISLLAYLPIQVEAAEYISGFPLPSGKVYNINCLAEYTVPYYDGSTYRYEHWVSLYHWKWGPLYGTTEDRYAVADIGAANGTKIFSVAEGRVWKTGYDSESGNWVIIHHSDGTYAYYGHMAAASKYKAGDSVSAGTQLGNVSAGHLHFEWSGHDPGCEYLNKGLVKLASAAKEKPHVHGTQSVSFEFYSNSSAGTTSDTWLYPAFKVTVPNYQNSKITTVGYYAYTASGDEMFRFQETYKSGVLKDGTSNKHTYFGARTDGGASLDASSDVTDVSRVYYIENLKFTSGHTYKVKGFVVFDGKRYESSEYTMSTTGSKQCTWDGGSVTKQPTCTATGVKTYTCRTCGVTKTESIAAKGHTPGPAATCLSAQTCTVCGVQLASSTWHKFDSGTITKRPTCMEEGIRTYTCIYCGHTETEPVSRSNSHTPGAEATCTSPQKCIDCGEQLAPPTGHNFDNGIIIKEPTCLEDGIKIFTCSSCGTTRTEPVYGRGHIRGEAATCTAPQTCTVCGTQLAPPLGHNYSGSYYYSAHPHEEYQKCTRCNAEKKTGNTKKVDGCSICYPIVTFTITYNANGGTGAPSPQTKESGKALTLSSVKPTRQGYTFLGWATSSGASNVQYNAGSSFTVDANTTLYAVWRKDEVITSDVNFELSSANAVPGSTVELTLKVAGTTKVDLLTVYNILYDKSVLEFQGVSEYGDLVKKCALPDNAFDDSNMSFTMGYADSTTASGTIAVLKFKVKDNAPEKDIIISYEAVATKDRLPVESSVKTSVVSISKWLSGDFNEDGKINMKDAVYFIGWVGAPFLPQFQINHSFNADFNKDGKINMKDAVYFIGWVGAPFLPQFKIDW